MFDNSEYYRKIGTLHWVLDLPNWRDLVLARVGDHYLYVDMYKHVVDSSKEITCPECEGHAPLYDCGCGKGTNCCDFYYIVEKPCPICGYHGLVLLAPESVDPQVVMDLNSLCPMVLGLPPDEDWNSSPSKIYHPGWMPRIEHPDQLHLWEMRSLLGG